MRSTSTKPAKSKLSTQSDEKLLKLLGDMREQLVKANLDREWSAVDLFRWLDEQERRLKCDGT